MRLWAFKLLVLSVSVIKQPHAARPVGFSFQFSRSIWIKETHKFPIFHFSAKATSRMIKLSKIKLVRCIYLSRHKAALSVTFSEGAASVKRRQQLAVQHKHSRARVPDLVMEMRWGPWRGRYPQAYPFVPTQTLVLYFLWGFTLFWPPQPHPATLCCPIRIGDVAPSLMRSICHQSFLLSPLSTTKPSCLFRTIKQQKSGLKGGNQLGVNLAH